MCAGAGRDRKKSTGREAGGGLLQNANSAEAKERPRATLRRSMEAVHSPLAAWESFYVIVGSSAAALTGLQFVVIALIAEARTRSSSLEIAAFGTPTVVHFCFVLLMSGLMSAPWPALLGVAVGLSISAISGVVYTLVVIRRATRQMGYRPVLEDWLFHSAFPLVAYLALLVAAVELPRHSTPALFVVAGAALLLLFVGIHNAWDAVTWVAVERSNPQTDPPNP
jgi:hypothetical protein